MVDRETTKEKTLDAQAMLGKLESEGKSAFRALTENGLRRAIEMNGEVSADRKRPHTSFDMTPQHFPFGRSGLVVRGGTYQYSFPLDFIADTTVGNAYLSVGLLPGELHPLLGSAKSDKAGIIKELEGMVEGTKQDPYMVPKVYIDELKNLITDLGLQLKGKKPKPRSAVAPAPDYTDGEASRLRRYYRRKRGAEYEIAEMEREFTERIGRAREALSNFDVRNARSVSITMGWTGWPVVCVQTTTTDFPFEHANDVGGGSFNGWGWSELGVQYRSPVVSIFTDVPFSERAKFLRLDAQYREEVLKEFSEQYKYGVQSLQRRPIEYRAEMIGKYAVIKQTEELIDQLVESLGLERSNYPSIKNVEIRR